LGRWQCACDVSGDRIFQTDAATAEDARTLADAICLLPELSLNEARCAAPTSSSTDLDCGAQTRCEWRISTPFAPTPNAWYAREVSASCTRLLDGQLHECSCGDDTQRYQVSALGVKQACGPFLDFCVASPRPPIDGPKTCTTINAAMSDIFCRTHESCGHTRALSLDVSIVASPTEQEWECLPGKISCRCTTTAGDITFQPAINGGTPTPQHCDAAAKLCRGEAVPTPNGTPTCQLSKTAATPNVCTADATCPIPATLNGLDVYVGGQLSIECERLDADAPWRCGCASKGNSAQLELGSLGASAADACAAALPRCAELVAISLGPYR
jgi:hypothetical protein